MSTPAFDAASTSRGARREEIRDALLSIMESMLESGETFTAISVERLAAEAGMSRTRFYMYFEDKGDLLYAWHLKLAAEAQAILGEWWERDGPIERDELHAVLRQVVALCRRHRTLITAIQDAAAVDARARAVVDGIVAEHIAHLQTVIERGQRGGWIDGELDAAGVAGWLGWLLERGIPQLVGNGSRQHLGRVAEAYTAIVWKTLYASAT
jgi:AcrR family transcriptional regulator